MGRSLVVLALVAAIPAAARAQPAAVPSPPTAVPSLADLQERARASALRGDCGAVVNVARDVLARNSGFYRDVFLADPVIQACNGGVGGRDLPPAPSMAPPPPASHRIDDGSRGLLGALAGGGLGLVGGIAAGLAGLAIAHDHYHCGDPCDRELVPGLLAGEAGMVFGLSLGITMVGNHAGGRGSFGWSLAAGLAGAALSWTLSSPRLVDSGLFGVAFFALPLTGSLTGYWLTHHHTAPTPTLLGASHAPGIALTLRF